MQWTIDCLERVAVAEKEKNVFKKSYNSKDQGFPYYFCLAIEGAGSGAGSVPRTNGSGSGRPKNVRIRNTARRKGYVEFQW
jgi:hypothetical protein